MRLTKELGRGYGTSNLKDMRQVFIKFSNRRTLFGDLSWNHYVLLSRLSSSREIEYYIHITKAQNLSIRELKERIKLKEYERIGYKEELEEPKVSTLIKNPIIIKTKDRITDEINEYALHQFILDDMESFLKELGNGFTFYGHEVKIKIGDNYHYFDFLLFNVEYNCYIVIEIKVTKMKAEYIGQVKKYMNYVDKNIKKTFHENTVGGNYMQKRR